MNRELLNYGNPFRLFWWRIAAVLDNRLADNRELIVSEFSAWKHWWHLGFTAVVQPAEWETSSAFSAPTPCGTYAFTNQRDQQYNGHRQMTSYIKKARSFFRLSVKRAVQWTNISDWRVSPRKLYRFPSVRPSVYPSVCLPGWTSCTTVKDKWRLIVEAKVSVRTFVHSSHFCASSQDPAILVDIGYMCDLKIVLVLVVHRKHFSSHKSRWVCVSILSVITLNIRLLNIGWSLCAPSLNYWFFCLGLLH